MRFLLTDDVIVESLEKVEELASFGKLKTVAVGSDYAECVVVCRHDFDVRMVIYIYIYIYINDIHVHIIDTPS